MSAYSASPPVIASTTAPRMKIPPQWWATKNCAPHQGLSAFTTSGLWPMLSTPVAAIARNHSSVTGPNTRPTFCVP